MNQKKKIPARKGEPRTYSYTFNVGQLVGMGTGLTLALTLFSGGKYLRDFAGSLTGGPARRA